MNTQMKRIFLVLTILFLANEVFAATCNELALTFQQSNEGEFSDAEMYSSLDSCRGNPDASALLYHDLFWLVARGQGNFASNQERWNDAIGLLILTAIRGDDDYLHSLANEFRSGDKIGDAVILPKDGVVADCLKAISGTPKEERSRRVMQCIPKDYLKLVSNALER